MVLFLSSDYKTLARVTVWAYRLCRLDCAGCCRAGIKNNSLFSDRMAKASAGQMIAYADVPEEKCVLMRFNRNVIASIEKGQKHVDEVMAFYKEQGR